MLCPIYVLCLTAKVHATRCVMCGAEVTCDAETQRCHLYPNHSDLFIQNGHGYTHRVCTIKCKADFLYLLATGKEKEVLDGHE